MTQERLIDETDDEMLNAGTSVFTIDKAKALVELFAKVTTSRDADAFVEGFTEDCVVRFNATDLRGREELKNFMSARFEKFSDGYLCEKTLRAISGNVLGVAWLSSWKDGETGETVQGHGSEFWIMRGEQIARWDATFGI